MSFLKITVWVTFIQVLLTSDGLACSCLRATPQQMLERADVVFTARVSGINYKSVTLRVTTVWKGKLGQIVIMPIGSTSCAVSWGPLGEYLVYARVKDSTLRTTVCDGTKSVKNAATDLEFLGQGKNP